MPRATNLKVLHGERRDRIPQGEPRPADVPLAKPAWLSPKAAEVWDELAPEAAALGARAADSLGLACLCETAALLRLVSDVLVAGGPLLSDGDGTRKHPLLPVRRDVSAELRAWLREYRLTPASRPWGDAPRPPLPGERLLSQP